VFLSSRKVLVLVLEVQFTSPCPRAVILEYNTGYRDTVIIVGSRVSKAGADGSVRQGNCVLARARTLLPGNQFWKRPQKVVCFEVVFYTGVS